MHMNGKTSVIMLWIENAAGPSSVHATIYLCQGFPPPLFIPPSHVSIIYKQFNLLFHLKDATIYP